MKKKISFLLLFCLLISAVYLPAAAEGNSKETVDGIIASIPADWPKAPDISAETAILIDADSGEILYAKNATEKAYPASTTKLMTALLTLENCSLQDIVDFPYEAVNIPSGSSHIGMRRGEQMVLRECLYGLLLPSANEVANALALHVSADLESFAELMNERGALMGLVNTHFTNCNGLHDENHYTCAYDLAQIMKACVKNATFVEISSTASYVHHADDLLPKDIPMTNTNLMIRPSSEYYYEYMVCGKTGHTAESGYNLVTYAEKDGMRLICVVMGCTDGNQFISTRSLMDYGFNYFSRVLPAELDSSLSMENSFTSSPLGIPTPGITLLELESTDSILIPASVTFDSCERTAEETEDGIEIAYSYEGYPLGTVRLTGSGEEEESYVMKPQEVSEVTQPEVRNLFVLDGWLLVILAVSILVLIIMISVMVRWTMPKKKKNKKIQRG